MILITISNLITMTFSIRHFHRKQRHSAGFTNELVPSGRQGPADWAHSVEPLDKADREKG